jgi:hypothetical protein
MIGRNGFNRPRPLLVTEMFGVLLSALDVILRDFSNPCFDGSSPFLHSSASSRILLLAANLCLRTRHHYHVEMPPCCLAMTMHHLTTRHRTTDTTPPTASASTKLARLAMETRLSHGPTFCDNHFGKISCRVASPQMQRSR